MGEEGPYELPPSCGCPCLIENILFLKPREAHSALIMHRVTCEWGQHWNNSSLCLYSLKLDMVRLDSCINGIWGFWDSNSYWKIKNLNLD